MDTFIFILVEDRNGVFEVRLVMGLLSVPWMIDELIRSFDGMMTDRVHRFQYLFVDDESDVDCPGSQRGPTRWEAAYQLPLLYIYKSKLAVISRRCRCYNQSLFQLVLLR
jgi:hypothetical protein